MYPELAKLKPSLVARTRFRTGFYVGDYRAMQMMSWRLIVEYIREWRYWLNCVNGAEAADTDGLWKNWKTRFRKCTTREHGTISGPACVVCV